MYLVPRKGATEYTNTRLWTNPVVRRTIISFLDRRELVKVARLSKQSLEEAVQEIYKEVTGTDMASLKAAISNAIRTLP